MANTIRIKRSNTPGAAPAVGDLDFGELAVNTFDGKLFIKKDDGTETIEEILLSPVYIAAAGYFSSVGATQKAHNLSCVRSSLGVYDLTFDVEMPDNNYILTCQVVESNAVRDDVKVHVVEGTQLTTGFQLSIYEGDNSNSPDTHVDRDFYVMIHDIR